MAYGNKTEVKDWWGNVKEVHVEKWDGSISVREPSWIGDGKEIATITTSPYLGNVSVNTTSGNSQIVHAPCFSNQSDFGYASENAGTIARNLDAKAQQKAAEKQATLSGAESSAYYGTSYGYGSSATGSRTTKSSASLAPFFVTALLVLLGCGLFSAIGNLAFSGGSVTGPPTTPQIYPSAVAPVPEEPPATQPAENLPPIEPVVQVLQPAIPIKAGDEGFAAYTVTTTSTLYSGPGEGYSPISTVEEGSNVVNMGLEENGWIIVQTPMSISGWIQVAHLH